MVPRNVGEMVLGFGVDQETLWSTLGSKDFCQQESLHLEMTVETAAVRSIIALVS